MFLPFNLNSGGAPIALTGGTAMSGADPRSGEVVFGPIAGADAPVSRRDLFVPGAIVLGLIGGAVLLRGK